MAITLADAFVRIRPDVSKTGAEIKEGVRKEAGEAGESVGKTFSEGFRKSLELIGALGAGLGIIDFFKDSIKEAEDAARVGRLTEQVLKSTGGAAKVSATQVHDYADALAASTGVSADVIQSGENVLLTFTQVRNGVGKGNDIFNQGTAAALNLSAALGQDMQSSIIQVGKALNDPIAGMTALKRVGVSFTESQKDAIKTAVAHNNLLGAQKIILAELTTEFGGAAAAATTPAEKAKEAWRQFKEELGTAVLPLIGKLATFLSGTVLPIIKDRIVPAIVELGTWFRVGFDYGTHGAEGMAIPLSALGHLVATVWDQAKAFWRGMTTGAGGTASTMQQLGAALRDYVIPALETLGVWLGKAVDWMSGGSKWAGLLRTALLGVVAGVTAYTIVVRVATAAQAAWDAAMGLNPIGLIVIAIAALVAGVIYAYTHFKTFRDIVNNTWEGIKVAALFAWNNVLHPIFDALVVTWRQVATVALWLWHNVLGPAFSGIAVAATWLWNVILRPVFMAIRAIIVDVLAPVFLWLWRNVIGPAFQGAKVEISIAWAIIKVIFEVIVIEVKILAAIFMWLWKNVLTPVWQGIWIIIQIAWALIQVIFGLMQIEIKILAAIFMGFYHDVIRPVWAGIKDAIALAWIAIKPYWDTMVSLIRTFLIPAFQLFVDKVRETWTGAKETISSIWNAIKPIFQAFGNIIRDDVVPSFKAGVAGIQAAWNGLVEVTKAPIRFVVNTVLEDGLLGAYRWIASKFGVDPNVHVRLPAGFAAGGRIPGTPSNADNMLAMVATGEHIMPTARTARWLPVLESIRLHDRLPLYPGDLSGLGIRGYAGGGVVGTLESLGSGLWDLFTDPAKLIRRVVGGIVDSVPGAGIVRDMAVGGAHRLLDGLIGWVKHLGGTGSLGAANAFLRSQNGKPYGWNMAGPDAYDCSGIVSAIFNVLHGRSPYSHTFSTGDEAGFFPLPGAGGVLTAGWTNPGETGVGGGPNGVGHTAGVLAGLPFESTGSGGVHMGGGVTPLDAFAHIGHYARGGVVPGLPGAPQLAVVHGGERVLEQGNSDLTDLMRELIVAVRQVAPGVGDHISGVGRSTLRAARAR